MLRLLIILGFAVLPTGSVLASDIDTKTAQVMRHGHAAAHGKHSHAQPINLPADAGAPDLEVEVIKDTVGGWNVHL